MRPFLSLVLLLTLATSFAPQPARKKIVFFGDSITQAGVQPKGYITRLQALLAEKGKGDQYELLGAGIGGNKVYDLYLRVEDDVLSKNPDAVLIWVGVNDVWHKRTSGTGTDADKFERFYQALIKKFRDRNIQVFMATPAVIGEKTDFSNELDGDLNRYSGIIRKVAKENNCTLVDLRKAFLDFNLKNNPENKEQGILTTDRVHLNEAGNNLVADEILKALTPGFFAK
ncbi:MAG TPA: SGNH/GDSL hydrolase family protein [Chitinophagaceae bacterium]|jgi:lysophospholipase L1-like esterase|nr:SGNH/GDSL hydrolase family protein [Chitinophagaceae bacterium]